MDKLTVPEFTISVVVGAVIVALVYILLFSLIKEPVRQKLSAIIIAGAGAVYWSGGLGVWEFVFGVVMLFVAYQGLSKYYFIGIGWLLHTIWDVAHHYYGDPIIYLDPGSSAGCAVCDPILAIWYFFNAPSILIWIKKLKLSA